MAVNWTKEQEQVINLRNRNILVSAAAGSGKTAVLVQRILKKVMDPEHPVDIDRLLIMTFTRAAAGEMRERIANALEDALCENPDNEHLQRQTTLIHTAQITTIDGFCAYVIRNYFHLIGLDPGYRTGEEGELKLLKEDVMKELLENYYIKDDKKFKYFIECYASGKTDDGIKELIYSLYNAAMSNPYPDTWLEECIDSYRNTDLESVKSSEWMNLLWKNITEDLCQAKELITQARSFCNAPGGPYLYDEALQSDLILIRAAEEKAAAGDFDGAGELLGKPAFAALSRKKPKDPVDDTLKEQVKSLRENAKDILKDIGTRYFSVKEEELPVLLETCREPVEMLVELTREFIRMYGEKKREKNILDFTDMEHFALEILIQRVHAAEENGENDGDWTGESKYIYHMSPAARELSLKYDEVMVDEYQDSNLVQEMITNCVSGWADGRKNIFMVGDVKQSIYRFRLARPELFMEKYETYSLEESVCQRIDLHKNFRSRAGVLKGVNQIFYRIMGKDLGAVEYDADAALYPGAVFEEKPEGTPEEPACQVLVAQTGTDGMDEKLQEQSDQELEARMIGEKIRSMVGTELVWDKKEKQYRPARYQDCVILLRTITGWAENFVNVLMDMGIPAYATSKTGYFSTTEVQTILNYLRILDNPMQEIPFTGVLLSPLGGCSARELALLKACYPQEKIYGCVWNYLQEGQDGELCEKLGNFWSVYEKLREKVTYTPIHELIGEILTKTGYGLYAGAMPGGAQRRANLQMLVEKAMEY